MKKILILINILCFLLFIFTPAFGFTVTLAWDKNPELNLKNYKVYVSNESQNYNSNIYYIVSPDKYSGYRIPVELTNSIMYYFVVSAINTDDLESGYSNEVFSDGSNPCKCDFDGDGDVDASDLAIFLAEFGRTNCIQ